MHHANLTARIVSLAPKLYKPAWKLPKEIYGKVYYSYHYWVSEVTVPLILAYRNPLFTKY